MRTVSVVGVPLNANIGPCFDFVSVVLLVETLRVGNILTQSCRELLQRVFVVGFVLNTNRLGSCQETIPGGH